MALEKCMGNDRIDKMLWIIRKKRRRKEMERRIKRKRERNRYKIESKLFM